MLPLILHIDNLTVAALNLSFMVIGLGLIVASLIHIKISTDTTPLLLSGKVYQREKIKAGLKVSAIGIALILLATYAVLILVVIFAWTLAVGFGRGIKILRHK